MYAEMNEGLVYAMWANDANPHLIETTTTFFNQDLFGAQSNFQNEVNDGAFGFIPALEWDTWVTIGDSYDDAVQTVGDLNINNFSTSSWSFGSTDASIFRTPDNVNCLPNEEGLVLLGQFTTDGILSGYINLRGKDENGDIWEETGIPLPISLDGCTDATACNYNSSATDDDGSCFY